MPYSVRENTFDGALKTIIDQFAKLNEEYESSAEDAAHWYTEGTSTALLSAAAWKSGYPALCETGSIKSKLTGKRGRPQISKGRVDLFLHLDKTPYWIEAKKVHDSMDASEVSEYLVSKKRLSRWFWFSYESALKNRKTAEQYDGMIGCMVFCSFILNSEYYAGANDYQRRKARAEYINDILNDVVNEDGSASYFASFFNTSDDVISDEFDNRAFGFAVLGYFESA